MTDEYLRQAYETTADLLTGKKTDFQFREPLARGAAGECYEREDGIIQIHILPRLGVQTAYKVALHEIAHVKLHPFTTLKTSQYKAAAQVDAAASNAQPITKVIEFQAQSLADGWIERAHSLIKSSIKWYTTPTERALMNLIALQTLAKLQEL